MDGEQGGVRPYWGLKLRSKIEGCSTVGGLAVKGCPKCGRRLIAEGSTGFGSLHCAVHGLVWIWIPEKGRAVYSGYAPRAWKNKITGETSTAWKKFKWALEK